MKSKPTGQPNEFLDTQAGGWRLRLVFRYVLLQVPEALILVVVLILIDRWWPMPNWLFWSLIGLWAAKDIALFPLLWRAYDWDHSNPSVSLSGERGIVVRRLDPEGYIRIRGELWRAKISPGMDPVEKGERVCVTDVDGLILHVRSPHRTQDLKGC